MKLNNFLSSILPSFGKSQITEDCRVTREELENTTIPAYTTSVSLWNTLNPKSKELADLTKVFKTTAQVKQGRNIIVSIHGSLEAVRQNVIQAEELVDAIFGDTIMVGGITIAKAQLIQFVEALFFVTKYSRVFLAYAYYLESKEFGGGDQANSMTAAELDWVKKNFLSYCQALNIVAGDPAKVRKAISEIPDIQLDLENARTLEHTQGLTKIDPLRMGFIPVWMNPIYHVRMRVVEWQNERYRLAREELKRVQLQKMNLEQLIRNRPDAKLQQELTYVQGRIDDLRYRIAEMEEA